MNIFPKWWQTLINFSTPPTLAAQPVPTLNHSLSCEILKSPWLFHISQLGRVFSEWCKRTPDCSKITFFLRLKGSEAQTVLAWWIKLCVCTPSEVMHFCRECTSWALLVPLYCPLHADAIKHNKCVALLYFLRGFHLCLPLSKREDGGVIWHLLLCWYVCVHKVPFSLSVESGLDTQGVRAAERWR